jgi:hypothetical protein
MGSNPISPGMEPSNFSGRTKKGMAFDISSAFKETLPDRADCQTHRQEELGLEFCLQRFSITKVIFVPGKLGRKPKRRQPRKRGY